MIIFTLVLIGISVVASILALLEINRQDKIIASQNFTLKTAIYKANKYDAMIKHYNAVRENYGVLVAGYRNLQFEVEELETYSKESAEILDKTTDKLESLILENTDLNKQLSEQFELLQDYDSKLIKFKQENEVLTTTLEKFKRMSYN
jgi:hypothetical protein